MTLVQAETMMEKVSGGMKKKIFAAIEAMKEGIQQFVIYSGAVNSPLTDVLKQGKGTVISK
jgi:acetylglutamate kinase